MTTGSIFIICLTVIVLVVYITHVVRGLIRLQMINNPPIEQIKAFKKDLVDIRRLAMAAYQKAFERGKRK